MDRDVCFVSLSEPRIDSRDRCRESAVNALIVGELDKARNGWVASSPFSAGTSAARLCCAAKSGGGRSGDGLSAGESNSALISSN